MNKIELTLTGKVIEQALYGVLTYFTDVDTRGECWRHTSQKIASVGNYGRLDIPMPFSITNEIEALSE